MISKKNRVLTLPISVEEWNKEKNGLETRGIELCMGIINPNGNVIIPEQER